jgi:carbon storage regulator
MLVLTLKKGEGVLLTGGIKVTLLEDKGNYSRVGFEAPRDIQILREDLYDAEKNADMGFGSAGPGSPGV